MSTDFDLVIRDFRARLVCDIQIYSMTRSIIIKTLICTVLGAYVCTLNILRKKSSRLATTWRPLGDQFPTLVGVSATIWRPLGDHFGKCPRALFTKSFRGTYIARYPTYLPKVSRRYGRYLSYGIVASPLW